MDSVATKIEDSVSELTVEAALNRTVSFEGAAAGVREYVEENEVDLVVMSSHGRSNLQRQLLGNVASTVLRPVDIPVLVGKAIRVIQSSVEAFLWFRRRREG